MDKQTLRDIFLFQDKEKKQLVERELFPVISIQKNTPFVIIISGVRRCGKSTLLRLLKTEESYYVNFDDDRFVDFSVLDFQLLYEVLIELFGEKHIFLFDEIQNIAGWERFVRRLHDNQKKVYITGSNASMLSRELGTHLTGRHLSYSLFPFSFQEFLVFKNYQTKKEMLTANEKAVLKNLFQEYLHRGGFPEYLQTGQEDYLRALYQHILYRDIITRYNLPVEKPIRETGYFAASNIAKEMSFNMIKTITGLSSATTVREYFEYLENSYLLFLIPRYNRSLKKQIYYNKKVYFIDPALAKLVGVRVSEDSGRILENTVFLALKRKNKEIYFHKEKHECDFVLREGINIVSAIQVTTVLKENKEREITGILEAMEKYNLPEGLILTEDEFGEITVKKKKIKIQPVWEWIL